MTWTDPETTLKTILDTITLTPNSIPSISKVVSIGWVDISNRGGPGGEITPQFTITKVGAPARPLDSNGLVTEISVKLQVDCWCQTYGPTENSKQLVEKMAEAVRQKIKANRKEPSSTILYMEVVDESDRDEAEYNPLLRRTSLFVRCLCRR